MSLFINTSKKRSTILKNIAVLLAAIIVVSLAVSGNSVKVHASDIYEEWDLEYMDDEFDEDDFYLDLEEDYENHEDDDYPYEEDLNIDDDYEPDSYDIDFERNTADFDVSNSIETSENNHTLDVTDIINNMDNLIEIAPVHLRIEENYELPFTDIPENSWYYKAVQFVYGEGYMTGTSASEFSPYANLTRGMLMKILYNMKKEDNNPYMNYKYTNFSDVAPDAWYSEAISWGVNHGIITGYGNGKFGPNDLLTREQMMIILKRFSAYIGNNTLLSADLSGYADSHSISSYAVNAVSWSVALGIISGCNTERLGPKSFVTRSEVAETLLKFCHAMKI